MNSLTTQLNDREKIENLIEQHIEAIKSQDIQKAVANYSDDLLMFDVVGELSSVTVQGVKERLTTWFATMQQLTDYESRIINIAADNNVAYCNTFNHIVAITKDGGQLDMWWRETLGCKKHNGQWVIATAHSSVPFDVQTGKASTSLKPSDYVTKQQFSNTNIDLANLVKNIFYAYETKDKSACEKMLTDDFTFTSPNNDDHISKDAYFERCWPFSEQNPVFEFEKIVVSGEDVFVVYNCVIKTNKKFRNTELVKFEKDRIKAVEVYFGNTNQKQITAGPTANANN